MVNARRPDVPCSAFEAWHEEMMLRIRPHRPKTPIVSAAVAIRFFADSRRRFDLSNAAESVMDLLVDAGSSRTVVPQLSLTFGGVEPKSPIAEISINEAVHG